MLYRDQRKLAAKLFPELAAVIKKDTNCFDEILRAAKPHRERIRAMWSKDWPQEWAFRWVREFPGDRECLRSFVTKDAWACCWARWFPEDREHMRQFVKEPDWVRCWAETYPQDLNYMRQKFPTSFP